LTQFPEDDDELSDYGGGRKMPAIDQQEDQEAEGEEYHHIEYE
jgi:hypothetical protein